jgi:hypothetical protein
MPHADSTTYLIPSEEGNTVYRPFIQPLSCDMQHYDQRSVIPQKHIA